MGAKAAKPDHWRNSRCCGASGLSHLEWHNYAVNLNPGILRRSSASCGCPLSGMNSPGGRRRHGAGWLALMHHVQRPHRNMFATCKVATSNETHVAHDGQSQAGFGAAGRTRRACTAVHALQERGGTHRKGRERQQVILYFRILELQPRSSGRSQMRSKSRHSRFVRKALDSSWTRMRHAL